MYNNITGIMFLYIISHLAGVACKDCTEPGGKKEEMDTEKFKQQGIVQLCMQWVCRGGGCV